MRAKDLDLRELLSFEPGGGVIRFALAFVDAGELVRGWLPAPDLARPRAGEASAARDPERDHVPRGHGLRARARERGAGPPRSLVARPGPSYGASMRTMVGLGIPAVPP
jgi:hypothetical protein